MDSLVNEFLKQCANQTERKFWITRTYDYIRYYSDDEKIRLWGSLCNYKLPSKIENVFYLGTIARVWKLETYQHRSPSCEEIKDYLWVSF